MGVGLFDEFADVTESVTDTSSGWAVSIVKVVIVLLVGVILMGNIDTDILQGSAGNRNLVFSEQPADGDLYQLDNHIFEFDNDGNYNSGYIPVTIGTTIVDTKNNLLTAIASAGYTVVDESEVIT
ncbi:hypothetical protein [Methanosarcina sp.]|uniref:hypothetical protein n=1 Tax=Methanosarcina sp. TaxID=2213 RepID=UPI002CBFD65C|nr:hypothetical protein [Methanosarcina sp.]HOW13498.1 hypothetical protein [Methanosarcina sp.]